MRSVIACWKLLYAIAYAFKGWCTIRFTFARRTPDERARCVQDWARGMLGNLCVDPMGGVMANCDRDGMRESYLTPADHRVEILRNQLADANLERRDAPRRERAAHQGAQQRVVGAGGIRG